MPSQHGLSNQMEEAAKEWFTAGPHDKVKFEIDLMVAAGPLGKQPLMHNPHTHALGFPLISTTISASLAHPP